ncbi:MFS transporter [Pseudarthrobacter oxydans]|uniref:MFS transporter n=1 Tax=Pseudarthrobacter oxydans TaxID=1671 RepID=UPI00103F31C5
MLSPLTLLKHYPKFRRVLFGEGLAMTGEAAFSIALAWLVITETGSIAALAGVLLAQAIPRGALLLLGGALTDRFSPGRVMLVCHLVRAGAMALVSTLSFTGTVQLWQLYILAAITGIASAFFAPASEAVLPRLLPGNELPQGNAVQGAVAQSAFIAGPMIGGALTGWGGAGLAIAVNALALTIAAYTSLNVPRGPIGSGSGSAAEVIRDIGLGLQHTARSHETRIVLLVISAATLSYSGLFAIGLPMLATSLSDSPIALSILVSGWGAGQLLGTVAAAVTGLPQRWGLLIISMTLVEGIAFALLGQTKEPWVAALILALVGIGVAYSTDVALPTFIQTRTPSHLLGRVSSVLELPRVILEPVSIALLGLVLAGSLQWGFLAAAAPVLIAGALLSLDKKARTLTAEGA